MRKGTKPSKPSLSTHTQQIANNINSYYPLTYTPSATQLSFVSGTQSISLNGMDDLAASSIVRLVTSSVVRKNASLKDQIKLLKADNIILNHKLKLCTAYLESLERASADDIKAMKPIRDILGQLYD